MNQKQVVGIDLGTTYSCIAHLDDVGKPVVLKNSEGHNVTPSVVFFESEDNVVVGKTAKNAMATDPEKVIAFMKRNMGRGDTYIVDGREYRPEEVSAFVIKRLVKDASDFLQTNIEEAVITVPAYFGENERAATQQAGELAGLNVRGIINEPTAAAISYGIDQEQDGTVMVFDLGGGTFDVTMINVTAGDITVVCTGGDHELGGKDWDEALLNYLVAEWAQQMSQTDVAVEDLDEETINDLRSLSEESKHQLSAREKLPVNVRLEGERAKIELTRDKFDEITGHLIDRTMELTKRMLEDAKEKGVEGYDKILLVGGSTRMPQVRDRLDKECGGEIISFDPDEAVAKGAALYGQLVALKDQVDQKMVDKVGEHASAAEKAEAQKEAIKDVAFELSLPQTKVDQLVNTSITNVTSKAFGVVALDANNKEEVTFLIHRNAALPANVTMPFGTAFPDQLNADIRVMEGEDEQAQEPDQSEKIGSTILDLPKGLAKGSQIDITFTMNEHGMLEATAKEVTRGGTISVSIERGESIMSDAQLEKARAALQRIEVT